MAATAPDRVIRLFLSSPGDVPDERKQVASVVQEVNTVLGAFVRDRRIAVELVRWETHVHPDMGAPQDVVDEQLGDYEIFLGVMWSRFGTPTEKAGSGTEQEFRDAYAGWERRRIPSHILFYFCDEPIPGPFSADKAEQLVRVASFHDELRHKGLVKSYVSHAAFADTVRPDLMLALSSIVHGRDERMEVAAQAAELAAEADLVEIRQRVAEVAREYERLRASMPPGPERTRRLEVVAAKMRTMAQTTYAVLPALVASTSPGERLAAITALQASPHPAYLEWLADRLPAEKPFVGYHAAVALFTAARSLPDCDLGAVADAVGRAIAGVAHLRPDTDRNATLANARTEVDRRLPSRASDTAGSY